ncbi:IPT/TIG domain-containing protein [Shewanella sp. 3_MG-2023]|uniref:IPT/TIG domain-containing protein n=1 Tax=Shewanella sp. 3_MG-2023 TaxID=3062635 RepID=UPI0026E36DB9|nr:IPT/TIG domain-containing protein [Shewanella sp. 3_MG-2023]MDO6777242.1 IPT/TIG domain-containing protein [Shewanella sp. 3_MG-2023]
MNQIVLRLAIVLIASLSMAECRLAIAAQGANQQFGSWENKDEDRDGVPDEQDDYPFDPSKNAFLLLNETEQNNLVETADNVKGAFSVRIAGSLPSSGDTDVFKLIFPKGQLTPNDRLSFIITSNHNHFYPTANLFDKNGRQLSTYRKDNLKPINGLKYRFTYIPKGNQIAYLSVSSLRQKGNASYTVEVFIDNDVDFMDDIKERALGMNHNRADTDGDGIYDGYEYFVYQNGQLNTDVDNDGVPNYLDDDSDGDGLLDKLELYSDFDNDSLSNFVDIDSDGNNITDEVEASNVNKPLDTDLDRTPDYIDLDDDADGVFDVYDNHRVTHFEHSEPHSGSLKVYGVNTMLSEQTQLRQQAMQGQLISISGTFAKNTQYTVVLHISGELFNEKVMTDDNGKLTLTIPKLNEIQTRVLSSSVFVYAEDGTNSNTSQFDLLVPQTPIILNFENRSYAKGEAITLKGWNFSPNTTAWFGDINVKASQFTSSKKIEFVIPENISEFNIRLNNGWGKGNSQALVIKNEFSVQLSVPSSLSSQYDRLYYDDANGDTTEFNTSGITKVNLPGLSDPFLILSVKKNEEYIRLFTLPIVGNGLQTVSLDSSIFAFLTFGNAELTLESMMANDKYPELYDYVYSQLKKDIYFFQFSDANSQNEFFSKLREFVNALPKPKRRGPRINS